MHNNTVKILACPAEIVKALEEYGWLVDNEKWNHPDLTLLNRKSYFVNWIEAVKTQMIWGD